MMVRTSVTLADADLAKLIDSIDPDIRGEAEAARERLRFYETTSAADVTRMLKDEQAEVRRLRSLVESWRQESIERGEAHNEMMRDRDSLRQQVRELTQENERLRGDKATMKLSRMLGLGDPVRPDIHAKACRERDRLRSDLSAALVSVDAMAERIEQMRPVYEAALRFPDAYDGKLVAPPEDWACIECKPHSDWPNINNGWRCPVHALLAAIDTALAHTAREQGKDPVQ